MPDMDKPSPDLSQTVSQTVFCVGAAAAFVAVAVWAWQLAAGSVLGFVLLLLLAAVFIGPLVAYGLPLVSMLAGLMAEGAAALIRWHRSRV